MPTIANINPYGPGQIFKKEVQFFTIDQTTGNPITEGYNVNGPSNSTIIPIPLPGGTKFVVQLTQNTTNNGAPFLKFHFPNNSSSNKMYVTFAVKNSSMADGYYDYKTGIPAPYRDNLRSFIISGLNGSPIYNAGQLMGLNGVKQKEIRFTTYGSSTNKPAEAVTFYITFKAMFTATMQQAQASSGNAIISPLPSGSGLAVGGGNVSGFANLGNLTLQTPLQGGN